MKAVVIGDIHIGAGLNFGKIDATTGLNTRLLDYQNTLGKIIDYCLFNKVEVVIMVGDIFEGRNPPASQLAIFCKEIKRLSDAKIQTVVIMGNHDYYKMKHITSSLDPIRELHIPYINIFNEIGSIQFEELNLVLMPYSNRQTYDKKTNEEAIIHLRAEITKQTQKVKNNKPTMLCGHLMLENTIPTDSGDQGINELCLPLDMFADCDITIMGHIHRHSVVKSKPYVIYSGSMECKDFGERDHQKVFLVYDSTKPIEDSIEFVKIPTRRFIDFDFDYSVEFTDETVNEILNKITDCNPKDAVVRVSIKIPETKKDAITANTVRSVLYNAGANCISDVSIVPIIARQMRNKKVTEHMDDLSAFKVYLNSQTDVQDGVLHMAEEIISSIKLDKNGTT